MKYFIDRNQQSFGPYTLHELHTYVASGSIFPADIARDDQTGATTTVANLMGQPAAPPPVSGFVPTPQQFIPQAGAIPLPPNLHWAIVLVISFVFTPFNVVWMIYQMMWIRNIDKGSKAIRYQVIGFVLFMVMCILGGVLLATSPDSNNPNLFSFLFFLLGFLGFTVFAILSFFDVRRSMLAYYNTIEPIGLRLSGVMTFFFNVYYFQYHMSRIVAWKLTGYLPPQG